MTISEMFLPEFDQEMGNTRKILALVPPDQFHYRPHEKSMELGFLASHVAMMPSWAAHTIQTEEFSMEAGEMPPQMHTPRELLDEFDKGVSQARDLIASTSDAALAKTWSFKYDGKTMMSAPRSEVLRSVVMNHMIHHRAQLGVYLRLLNIAIPGMYGPSADEPRFWEAATA